MSSSSPSESSSPEVVSSSSTEESSTSIVLSSSVGVTCDELRPFEVTFGKPLPSGVASAGPEFTSEESSFVSEESSSVPEESSSVSDDLSSSSGEVDSDKPSPFKVEGKTAALKVVGGANGAARCCNPSGPCLLITAEEDNRRKHTHMVRTVVRMESIMNKRSAVMNV